MDMFGPFYIEDKGKGTQKHYVGLFTSLVTRAVHLDVCYDLTTDFLLMAIRRFESRRGYLDLIVSDIDKNFIGGNQAMKLYFQRSYQPDNGYIKLGGGVMEMLMQTTKRSILIVLGSRKLTLSFLQTVVAEAKAISNFRPLTHVSYRIPDEGTLTPNHFLLCRLHLCLNPLVAKTSESPLRTSS